MVLNAECSDVPIQSYEAWKMSDRKLRYSLLRIRGLSIQYNSCLLWSHNNWLSSIKSPHHSSYNLHLFLPTILSNTPLTILQGGPLHPPVHNRDLILSRINGVKQLANNHVLLIQLIGTLVWNTKTDGSEINVFASCYSGMQQFTWKCRCEYIYPVYHCVYEHTVTWMNQINEILESTK